MKNTILEGLHYWGVYQPDRRIDFNGFLWVRPGGNVLIDPMPVDEHQAGILTEAGGARWVLVSNADHLRAAPQLAERLDARIVAPAADRERFGEHAAGIHHWFENSADLPEGLRGDVEVHAIRGGKSAVEPALFLPALGALYFADVVRSHVSGALMLLPEAKLADRAAVVESLKPLADLPVRAVLLGDGDSLFTGAREELQRFLGAL